MQVDRYPNVTGWAGTNRTIRAMEDMVKKGRADETIIFLASQVLRKVDPKDYFGQVSALHEWVKKNIHYVRDPNGVELLRSPFWTLYYKAGDCDDQAVLLSSLAQAVGFKTKFKAIKGDSRFPDEFSHVYSQVLIPEKGWVTSDTIVPHAKLGWESEERFGSYTWGGLGMLGEESISIDVDPGYDNPNVFERIIAETSAARSAPASAPPVAEKNIWGMLGDVLQTTVVGAANAYGSQLIASLQQDYGELATAAQPTQKAAAASGSSMIGPAALIGGAGVLAFLIMRKKRR